MWDLLIEKRDLRRTTVREATRPRLADGEALFEVESFALTANNITYGAIGDAFGYWKFFPAAEGMGRIPVWGHARVIESRAKAAPVGARVFGYLPMSTHVVMRPVAGGGGLIDASEHRAGLPPTYNAYPPAAGDALEDHRSVLRPLFMTSYLLDAQLAETDERTVLLSSASSKTAMGLAWLLRARGAKAIGLTSSGKVATLADKGLYDQLIPYDQVPDLQLDGPVAYVDFAGDGQVIGAVHRRLAGQLSLSLTVGATHWEGDRERGELPGPQPVLFFAPDVIRRLASGGGAAAFFGGFEARMAAFVAANPWLKLVFHEGPEALQKVYADVLEGRATPDQGHIIRPTARA